ncbi:DUF3575 domain-containing protein [Prevotella sp. oral taxon 317]|uniref:DUF3575 domain-containing protein n=1 Tax=Prevotella sp. oral taxon 317 TaxID=652721 RepID=UPI001E5A1312|nr:DUF3575 domain-containing protein [Prevotella sp. oral taxon 317]
MKGYKLILALTVQLFVGVTGALGQGNQLYYNKVDTMELQNRFNLKTDAVGWLTLTPNLGLEFSLGNKNWNQWTVGVYGRANWDVNTRTKSYYVYDIFGARAEVRKYWHAKMPKRAYYIGLYGGANSFDIKFSDIGKKGNSFVGGLMVGMVTQVYGYTNGASLDLELGFSPGVVFADMHDYTRLYKGGKYYYSRTTRDTGYKLTFNPWVYAASVDVVHVSFVYHFGTKLANRYKNRNLIDNDYRLAVEKEKIRRDSVHTVQAKEKRIKMDSLAKADYERRFEEQRLEIERAYTQDSIRQENKALKEKQAVEREEAKHRADSLKEAARIKAMEDKANAKITADSLKFAEKARQLEEKENAKRTADSLKYAAQERARELKEQKAMERENAKRTADSIKVAQKMEKQQSEADKKKSDSSAPQEDVDASQTPQVEDTALPKEEKDGQSKENPESKSKDDGQSTEKPVTEEKRAEEKKSETKEDHESPEAKPSGENGKSEEGSDNSDNKEKAESGIVKHVSETKVLVCEKDSRRSLCPFFDANMLKNLNSIGYSSYSGVYLGQIDRNALCAFGDSFSQN